jgi:hypothetical protein
MLQVQKPGSFHAEFEEPVTQGFSLSWYVADAPEL